MDRFARLGNRLRVCQIKFIDDLCHDFIRKRKQVQWRHLLQNDLRTRGSNDCKIKTTQASRNGGKPERIFMLRSLAI